MYILEPGDPVRESRRDIARYGGALLAAGLVLGPAIAAATHHFGLSDAADPPGWVHTADLTVIAAIPGLAATGTILTLVRAVRPLGHGILIGTAAAIAGTAALVAAIGIA